MKIKILLGALMAVFFTACSSDATSEAENQLTQLLNDQVDKDLKITFKSKDSEIVFQNDSLVVLHSYVYTKGDGEEYGDPFEYACVKSYDGKKYEIAILMGDAGFTQSVIPKHLDINNISQEDGELITNNVLKLLNKNGRVMDNNQPISQNQFAPVLKTGFWELGIPPYPESKLVQGLNCEPKAAYMVLADKNRGNGMSVPDFIDNKLVLIITKDKLDVLKNGRSNDEFVELVTSPDFLELHPEYQDPYRLSFRVTDALTKGCKKGGYCDLSVIRSNGDTCYTTNSDMFYYKWSDKWVKPNGTEEDGNFVPRLGHALLNELYKEDCFKIQVTLYDRMCGHNGTMEFTCDTRGLNEVLKQL